MSANVKKRVKTLDTLDAGSSLYAWRSMTDERDPRALQRANSSYNISRSPTVDPRSRRVSANSARNEATSESPAAIGKSSGPPPLANTSPVTVYRAVEDARNQRLVLAHRHARNAQHRAMLSRLARHQLELYEAALHSSGGLRRGLTPHGVKTCMHHTHKRGYSPDKVAMGEEEIEKPKSPVEPETIAKAATEAEQSEGKKSQESVDEKAVPQTERKLPSRTPSQTLRAKANALKPAPLNPRLAHKHPDLPSVTAAIVFDEQASEEIDAKYRAASQTVSKILSEVTSTWAAKVDASDEEKRVFARARRELVMKLVDANQIVSSMAGRRPFHDWDASRGPNELGEQWPRTLAELLAYVDTVSVGEDKSDAALLERWRRAARAWPGKCRPCEPAGLTVQVYGSGAEPVGTMAAQSVCIRPGRRGESAVKDESHGTRIVSEQYAGDAVISVYTEN